MNSQMMRNALLILCLGMWSWVANAQETPGIEFEKTTHEFGEMDKGELAEYSFMFTNVTEEPITLERVKASCGCTTPSYTREAIQPGEQGEIKVKYNTARIGPFTKTVTVNYSNSTRPIVLYIKGQVNNTQTGVDNVYKRPMGSLIFDEITQNFGTIDSDKEASVTFRVRNGGALPIRIGFDLANNPEFEAQLSATELIPGATGTITLTAVGERFEEMGAFTRRITLSTSDQAMPEKPLTVTGVLNKVFSAAELAAMPNIQFEVTSYDAGKVISGEKVVYAYRFTNTGENDLVIESVKASCGCTATAPKDDVVASGQDSEIVATFDTRGRQGRQAKSITVRTNDPDQPVIVLRLTAEVEADPFHMGGTGPAEGGQ